VEAKTHTHAREKKQKKPHIQTRDGHAQSSNKSLVTALIEGRAHAIELKRTEQEFLLQTFLCSQLTCEITVPLHRFDKTAPKKEELLQPESWNGL